MGFGRGSFSSASWHGPFGSPEYAKSRDETYMKTSVMVEYTCGMKKVVDREKCKNSRPALCKTLLVLLLSLLLLLLLSLSLLLIVVLLLQMAGKKNLAI